MQFIDALDVFGETADAEPEDGGGDRDVCVGGRRAHHKWAGPRVWPAAATAALTAVRVVGGVGSGRHVGGGGVGRSGVAGGVRSV